MNRISVAAFGTALSLLLATPALAHEAEVDGDALQRDVTVLSHDNMEGREAGTRGYARAAGYVAGRMAALGLEPAGDDGTYFQAVPMLRVDRAEEGNALAISGMEPLTMWEDFYVTGSSQQESGQLEAELVFIGYGLDLPERDDFDGVDLDGKIALRVYGGPANLNTEEAAHYRSTLAARVAEQGAVGMLLVWTPALSNIYTWERLTGQARHSAGMTWLNGDGTPHSDSPGLLVSGILHPDVSRALLDGLDFDYDDLVAAEMTTEKRFPSFATGRSARIGFASHFTRIDAPNVIGMLPGSDPSLTDEYVVLTAHLDHVGIQPTEEEGDDEIYNGAMDNAVGVSSMIEVARLLAEHPPRRPVLFVALTAEEKGLVGSEYNAANPTVPAEQVVANVNLDMPIASYAFSDVVAFGAERSNMYPQVVAAAEEYGLTLSPDPQPEQGFFTRSDQYSYVKQGVPAVYLDIGFGNGGEAAQGEFLSTHYHQASDEVELVDFAALERFTGANFAIARNIANMDERPEWNAGDFFGETFAAGTGGEH
ncbi:M28 family metallopeptidase [Alteraurantiacibacter aquimixticola]|uniref:M28 family peptidase n=1 Tax=Alteraurantiacibacter aquimixticola TaxID=2489173 RepID=A0A4T3F4Q6_9SPHN|nr:M28 family metallopeptidase [Alteraurantiacibacter aquimixticola]TIX51771.1 M28 family peptidase [Alteraurantiacibacter aquimixticola]